jgi:hypothetical protein
MHLSSRGNFGKPRLVPSVLASAAVEIGRAWLGFKRMRAVQEGEADTVLGSQDILSSDDAPESTILCNAQEIRSVREDEESGNEFGFMYFAQMEFD